MTIAYNEDIASSSILNLLRVLFRWRGSVWKSVIGELIIWTIAYLCISGIYRLGMSTEQQRFFERIADYCDKGVNDIPLTFLLGFFVSIVIQRWNDAFKNMGYLSNQAIHISNFILGDDDDSRLIRRTVARYLCLAQVIVFRDLSIRVRKRFPTMESIVKAGFMMEHEKAKFDSYKCDYDKYWVPINWAFALVIKARKDDKILADTYAVKICDEIRAYRDSLQMLCNYDWVEIPLVYPQVVFLSVHTYFFVCLIGRQFIIGVDAPNHSQIDIIFPVMTMLQYLFFVGWMKVAESLLNPFGEDDDDFECNFLIDRNFATSLCIVDEAHDDVPPLEKDLFWSSGDIEPLYLKDSNPAPVNPMIGSAARAAGSVKDQPEPEMVARSFDHKPESLMKRAFTTVGGKKFTAADDSVINRSSASCMVQAGDMIDGVHPQDAMFRLDRLKRHNLSFGNSGVSHSELSAIPDRAEEPSNVRHARFAADPVEDREKSMETRLTMVKEIRESSVDDDISVCSNEDVGSRKRNGTK